MAEKKPKGKPSKPGESAPPAGETAQSRRAEPDVNVLLYLQTASRSFPGIERRFQRSITEALRKTSDNRDAYAEKKEKVDEKVAAYMTLAANRETELRQLKIHLAVLTDQRKRLADAHAAAMAETAGQNAKRLAEMKERTTFMTAEFEEAKAWHAIRQPQLSALAGVTEAIAAENQRHEAKTKALMEGHEQLKREMRDVLIARLRKIRDCICAVGDKEDESSTEGSSSVSNTKGTARRSDAVNDDLITSLTPTAKMNERLSQAVTMYTQEARALGDEVSHLEEKTKMFTGELEAVRYQNEKLSVRNASHAKTATILKEQLKAVKPKYLFIEEAQLQDSKARVQVLRETVVQQRDTIDELQFAVAKARSTHSKLQTQHQGLLDTVRRHEEMRQFAVDFFRKCRKMLTQRHSAATQVTLSPMQPPRLQPLLVGPSTLVPRPPAVEPIPVLGLQTDEDICVFFAAILKL